MLCLFISAYGTENLVAIFSRHHDIQDDQIRELHRQQVLQLLTVIDGSDLEAALTKRKGDDLAYFPVIIYDKNTFCHSSHPAFHFLFRFCSTPITSVRQLTLYSSSAIIHVIAIIQNIYEEQDMILSSPAWTDILQTIIREPEEQQRLAVLLGITSDTLGYWASGKITPPLSQLTRLVRIVKPQVREELLGALTVLYPDIARSLRSAGSDRIPASFFADVLSARTTTTESLGFWRLSEMVLKQALDQLDPNGLGLVISVVQCMPPVDGEIRSLRESIGKGTLPWSANLDNLALFLGLESLAGYCVEVRRPVSVDDLSKDTLVPAYQTEYEISSAAHPILLGGLIAGCLLASSTQIGYFSQQRLTLLAAFSDVIALALPQDNFYPPERLALRAMPKPEKQRPILDTFRQRVSRELLASSREQRQVGNEWAERKVWQEIEKELLSL